MQIPRNIIEAVAPWTSKNDGRRNLEGVRLERDKDGKPLAIATQGHVLVRATWPEFPCEELPREAGRAEAVAGFAATVEVEPLLRAAKAAPRSTLPIVDRRLFLDESNVNGVAEFRATDSGGPAMTTSIPTIAADFPPWAQVLPKEDRKCVRIGVNANYLVAACKSLATAVPGGRGQVVIELEIPTDPTAPIKLRRNDGDGSEAIAVVMPCRL